MSVLTRRLRVGWTARLLLMTGLLTGAAACEHVTNKEIGAGMGSIAGALVGSQFGSGSSRVATTAFGAFAGGIVGAELGGRMDEAESRPPEEAYEYEEELESGAGTKTVGWKNPDAEEGEDSASTVTEDGRVCREFRQEIDVRGNRTISYGRACRNAEGVWEIENSRS